MSETRAGLVAFHEQTKYSWNEPDHQSGINNQFVDVMGRINGLTLQEQLQELSSIGATEQPIKPFREPERWPTNRLGLSEEDDRGREYVRKLMEEAGLELDTHPMADLGILEGEDPDLSPVVLISHTDTVPNGDMYDGCYGVLSYIAAAKAMKEVGYKPKRTLIVISCTLEESSNFGFALAGSRALFHGLTEQELDSRQSEAMGGKSLREVLGPEAVEIVKQPIFGEDKKYKKPARALELHVEQDSELWDSKGRIEVGLAENIAAPMRYKVKIGEDKPLEPRPSDYPLSNIFEIEAQGTAAHSGATPMGREYRSDGLVWTNDILHRLYESRECGDRLALGDITVYKGAINKVPGNTKTQIRISGKTQEEIDALKNVLLEEIQKQNIDIGSDEVTGRKAKVRLNDLEEEKSGDFFEPNEMFLRQGAALALIKAVEKECSIDPDVVGTIGAVEASKDGVITLAMDVRGVKKEPRDRALQKIKDILSYFSIYSGVEFGEPLSGSGDPITLDGLAVDGLERLAYRYEVATTARLNSKALHDIGNIALSNIGSGVPGDIHPTDTKCSLIFVPSKYGIAHEPSATTFSYQLEPGARLVTLAALSASNFVAAYEDKNWAKHDEEFGSQTSS